MKGFGTVVTGTTIAGLVRTGDEVTLYPKSLEARIRGIQVHNREVQEVSAGLRTAINLQGVKGADRARRCRGHERFPEAHSNRGCGPSPPQECTQKDQEQGESAFPHGHLGDHFDGGASG